MKTKLLLACGLTLALAACSEQHNTETTPAPQKPAATQTTAAPSAAKTTAVVKAAAPAAASTLPESSLPVPAWASQKSKTIAPSGKVTSDGQSYDVIFACKPNDCGGDFMYTATNETTKKVYSLVVNVKDVDGAITEPSKYATYWFVGNPDAQVKALLQKKLQSDPNWK